MPKHQTPVTFMLASGSAHKKQQQGLGSCCPTTCCCPESDLKGLSRQGAGQLRTWERKPPPGALKCTFVPNAPQRENSFIAAHQGACSAAPVAQPENTGHEPGNKTQQLATGQICAMGQISATSSEWWWKPCAEAFPCTLI